MNRGTTRAVAGAACAVAVLVAGCATTPDRADGARDMKAALEARAGRLLPADAPLALEDCLRIALTNSLDEGLATLRVRLARLERQSAFGQFLPTVTLGADYTAWDPQPRQRVEGAAGPTYIAMHDPRIHAENIQIGVPLVAPSSWYVYAARRRGEEIATRLRDHARQTIVLNVVALYYQCVSLDETAAAAEDGVRAGDALALQLRGLADEGLVRGWQASEAEALALGRRAERESLRRSRRQAGGELLRAMGLSPGGELRLAPAPAPVAAPEGTVEDLVWRALLSHPLLHAADAQTAAARAGVYVALAEFLPRIVGFVSLEHTSKEYVEKADQLTFGVSGVLSVFNGFSSVAAYRAARAREEASFLEREETCLRIMLQVVSARQALDTAQDRAEVAAKLGEAAEGRWNDLAARAGEGFVEPAVRLQALADVADARTRAVVTRYARQTAAAALWAAIGELDANAWRPK